MANRRFLASLAARRVIGIAAAIALVALLATFFGFVTWAPGMTLLVHEEDTDAPIGNAVVLATWTATSSHGFPVEVVKVVEAVSDSDGRVRFRGWGPIVRLDEGAIRSREPHIRILKSGYLPFDAETQLGLASKLYLNPRKQESSAVDESTIVFLRRGESSALPGISVSAFTTGVLALRMERNCVWIGAMKFLKAFEKWEAESGLPVHPMSTTESEVRCGAVAHD